MRKTILIAVVAIMLFSSIGLLTGHSVNTVVQTPGGAGNAIITIATIIITATTEIMV